MAKAYMSKETLADALDLKPGAIDQYVKRGLIPEPIRIGDALRWRWEDVDKALNGVHQDVSPNYDDPYMQGIGHGENGTGGAPASHPRGNGAG